MEKIENNKNDDDNNSNEFLNIYKCLLAKILHKNTYRKGKIANPVCFVLSLLYKENNLSRIGLMSKT